MFDKLAQDFESLERSVLTLPDARTDTEALVRVELCNLLARVGVLLRALAADHATDGKP